MKKIIGVYKITNTITGDFYIGSSKDVKNRWLQHKRPSAWKRCQNNPLYLDMKKYGVEKFAFEILAEVEIKCLKEAEQKFIEKLKPAYNNYNAKGWDVGRQKERNKKYRKSDKYKEWKEEYRKSDKYKEYRKKYDKEHNNKLCLYNNEILTLSALASRFKRSGIEHYTKEAKKYIIMN